MCNTLINIIYKFHILIKIYNFDLANYFFPLFSAAACLAVYTSPQKKGPAYNSANLAKNHAFNSYVWRVITRSRWQVITKLHSVGVVNYVLYLLSHTAAAAAQNVWYKREKRS